MIPTIPMMLPKMMLPKWSLLQFKNIFRAIAARKVEAFTVCLKDAVKDGRTVSIQQPDGHRRNILAAIAASKGPLGVVNHDDVKMFRLALAAGASPAVFIDANSNQFLFSNLLFMCARMSDTRPEKIHYEKMLKYLIAAGISEDLLNHELSALIERRIPVDMFKSPDPVVRAELVGIAKETFGTQLTVHAEVVEEDPPYLWQAGMRPHSL